MLHANIFGAFLIRSIIQLLAELHMSNGYFLHNVFERTDACNRTTIYYKEDRVRIPRVKHEKCISSLSSCSIANYSPF